MHHRLRYGFNSEMGVVPPMESRPPRGAALDCFLAAYLAEQQLHCDWRVCKHVSTKSRTERRLEHRGADGILFCYSIEGHTSNPVETSKEAPCRVGAARTLDWRCTRAHSRPHCGNPADGE